MSAFGPLMISIASLGLSQNERGWLHDPKIGGVILFKQNYKDKTQLSQLILEIKDIDEALIIAVDHEGGRVQRFKDGAFTHLPAAATFGRYYDDDPEGACRLIEATGALVASELKSAGIDCGFSPVLDLNTGNSNVIGDRAYHRNPVIVTALAAAFIRGLHSGGIMSVGKHYPGHGSVEGDTHTELVHDNRSVKDIYLFDTMPYQRLIEQNLLDAVMMAHVIYPAMDSVPASLSEKWMNQSLIKDLGFNGIVFSDDVNMRGIKGQSLPAQEILAAGCHMIIACHDQQLIEKLVKELDGYAIDSHREKFREHWLARQSIIAQTYANSAKNNYEFSQIKIDLSSLTEQYNETIQ